MIRSTRQREREQAQQRQHEAWIASVTEWRNCPLNLLAAVGCPPRLRDALRDVWNGLSLETKRALVVTWREERLRLIVRVVPGLEQDGQRVAGRFIAAEEDRPNVIEFDRAHVEGLSDPALHFLVGHEVGHFLDHVIGLAPDEREEVEADRYAADAGFPRAVTEFGARPTE